MTPGGRDRPSRGTGRACTPVDPGRRSPGRPDREPLPRGGAAPGPPHPSHPTRLTLTHRPSRDPPHKCGGFAPSHAPALTCVQPPGCGPRNASRLFGPWWPKLGDYPYPWGVYLWRRSRVGVVGSPGGGRASGSTGQPGGLRRPGTPGDSADREAGRPGGQDRGPGVSPGLGGAARCGGSPGAGRDPRETRPRPGRGQTGGARPGGLG